MKTLEIHPTPGLLPRLPGKQGYVRLEWNPAAAGVSGNTYLLNKLPRLIPEPVADFIGQAYVNRIDLAVDVPDRKCSQLLAVRTTHHKRVEIQTNAKGAVRCVKIGARKSASATSYYLRVYDRKLPHHDNVEGVRAEIEISRAGPLSTVGGLNNPFAKFKLYDFPQGVIDQPFGCFMAAARERGTKRALAMFPGSQAADLQAAVDQHLAPWWEPSSLWQRAQTRITDLFEALDLPNAA